MQMEKCCQQLQSLGGSGYVLVVETALPLYSVSFKHTSIFGADVTACCQGGAGVHRGADPNYRVSNLFQVILSVKEPVSTANVKSHRAQCWSML